MDRKVAAGLGVPVEEYVDALLNRRVKTERFEKGSVKDGVILHKTRVVFSYQGRQTYLELED